MVLITGPLYSGKRAFARAEFGLAEGDFSPAFPCNAPAVCEAQTLAAGLSGGGLTALADALAQKQVVTCSEVGGGVVPIDPQQRADREAAGHLAQLLAARADRVVRVWCGLPQELKGPGTDKLR